MASVLSLGVPGALLIAFGLGSGRGAYDSIVYHEVFVRQLLSDWPRFDLSNPMTATTPGFHILMAAFARFVSPSTMGMRLLSLLIGIVFVACLARWCSSRVSPRDAYLLSLPVICSIHTFQSSIWLLPDNLAWLLVASIMFLCLRDPPGYTRLFFAAVLLVALVSTRQIHVWASAALWTAAWIGVRYSEAGIARPSLRRLARVALAVLLTAPSFAILAWFVRTWGGLTPPRFQTDMHGGNPATPAFILLQVGVLSMGFGPWLWAGTCRMVRDHRWIFLICMVVGLALAIVPETTFNKEMGRSSGWWNLVKWAPTLLGRTSLVFVVLCPLGAVVLGGALLAVPRRASWMWLACFTAFVAAQSASAFSWQRYHEPFIILMLSMLASTQPQELRDSFFARLRVPCMLGLCSMLAVVSIQSIRGPQVPAGELPPAKHTVPTDPWADRVLFDEPRTDSPEVRTAPAAGP